MRKKNLVLPLLIFSSILPAQAPPTSPWQQYSFKADGFSIAAPQSPRITNPPAPDVRIYHWELSANTVFVIHIGVVSGCQHDITRLKNLSKNRSDGASMKDIFLDGNRGIGGEYTQEASGRKVWERLYCVKNVAYDLSALYPPDQARPAAIDRMFSSFRFLNGNSQ